MLSAIVFLGGDGGYEVVVIGPGFEPGARALMRPEDCLACGRCVR